jgi:subtilisin family serine protease
MTGRYLMTLRPETHKEIASALASIGIAAATPIATGAQTARAMPIGHHIVFPRVGVAVIDPTPGQQEDELHAMAAREANVFALEPERINRTVIQDVAEYVRGWRDATDALAAKLIEMPSAPGAAVAAAEELATWGLVATGVVNSRFSGQGIKIAVLDTGFDITHPDFVGRTITTMNFVGDNAPFHDGHGHGTHCIGTAAGPLHPASGPRYGIAYQAEIFAGRVLDDTGNGGDSNILHGIDWAIENGCAVVSLSLGSPWRPGDPPYSPAYEQAAQRAIAAGCLLVAAAGNEADPNDGYVGAVGTPGNSPSVLTVAAVDRTLATASFSDRIEADAPGVKGPDLAGPGVDVRSSWPVADGSYNTLSGTSMATPHVSGIAALCAEANPAARGQALKDFALRTCSALPNGDARQGETGRGLVHAPPNQ